MPIKPPRFSFKKKKKAKKKRIMSLEDLLPHPEESVDAPKDIKFPPKLNVLPPEKNEEDNGS